MPRDTTPAPLKPRTQQRFAYKVWLTSTECTMLEELAERGSLSNSAAVRGAILHEWERTFQRGPGRRDT